MSFLPDLQSPLRLDRSSAQAILGSEEASITVCAYSFFSLVEDNDLCIHCKWQTSQYVFCLRYLGNETEPAVKTSWLKVEMCTYSSLYRAHVSHGYVLTAMD